MPLHRPARSSTRDPLLTPRGHRLHAGVEVLAGSPRLQGPVERLAPLVERIVPLGPRRDALRGSWLGHALHPLLTDIPIGSWTSASVLDLVGGAAARPAARRLVALGLLSAPAVFVTGVAEWADADAGSRRLGVVHASANAIGTMLYLRSYLLRRRQRHGAATLYALGGMTVATVGGYLGGHLAFARATGVTLPGGPADAARADDEAPRDGDGDDEGNGSPQR